MAKLREVTTLGGEHRDGQEEGPGQPPSRDVGREGSRNLREQCSRRRDRLGRRPEVFGKGVGIAHPVAEGRGWQGSRRTEEGDPQVVPPAGRARTQSWGRRLGTTREGDALTVSMRPSIHRRSFIH